MTRPLYLTLTLLLSAFYTARADVTGERIEAILSKLTLEEKLGQLRLVDGHAGGGWKPEHMAQARAGVLGGTFNVRGTGPTSEMQKAALSARHKIPLVFAFDVVHGYRTIFPVPLGETASWDPELAKRCAAVAAKESRSANVSWTFAPVADIARDPRWGRIVEGSGEDPVLSSAFTAARVHGFQGKDISAPDRMMACLKHFAGSGEAEGGRDYNFADVSVRALRETHFPPFIAGLQAGAASIMPSFSAIDGVPATSNPWLLQDVLRKEWDFKGVVVSDYDAVGQLVNHRVSPTWPEAGKIALRAGLDVEIWGSCMMQAEALIDDAADMKLVDDAVRRVLGMKFQLGLFDHPFGDAAREKEAILHPDHLKLAQEAAAKSCVLLKNNDAMLPIPPAAKKIAIIGALANDKLSQLGCWTGDGRPEDSVTLVEAVRQRLGNTGTVIHASAGSSSGFSFRKPSDGVDEAKDADYVIVVVGENGDMSGEATSKSSLDLPQQQIELVQKVHALGKPYAVVLMTGRPLTVGWLAETCPAILLAWHGGTMAGPGIADVLFGDVNPSGKLPVTFPRSVGQIPLTYNSTPTSRPLVEGDKWTSKYTDIKNSPLWPFGHGLSYTNFQISPPQLEKRIVPHNGSVRFKVSVTNQGERDGDEVVQVYLRDEVAFVTRPMKELKAFKRVSVAAGKSVNVDFEIPAKDLGYWMPNGEYRVEPGTFTLMTGGNSAQVRSVNFSLE
jgi:beta-glucosidase